MGICGIAGLWNIPHFRKDAFPGADGSTIPQTDGENASTISIYNANGILLIENSEDGLRKVEITESGVLQANNAYIYTVKHPMTFICSLLIPYDWYTDNETYQNDILWGYGTTMKSSFDPCPQGWRIPQNNIWMDFSTTTAPYFIQGEQSFIVTYSASNGVCYNHTVWYPAIGMRRRVSGELGNIGRGGNYWSNIAANTMSYAFNFNPDGMSSSGSALSGRAYGFSVRCVQE